MTDLPRGREISQTAVSAEAATEILMLAELLGIVDTDERMLQRIGHVLITVMEAHYASLYLYDQNLRRTTSHAQVGMTGAEIQQVAPHVSVSPLDVPVERAVIESKRSVQRASPDDFIRSPDLALLYLNEATTDIVIPLAYGDRVLGVAYVVRRVANDPFSPAQVSLAEAVGRHAALALQHARHAQRLEALNAIGHKLSGTHELDTLYRTIHESAAGILPLDAFYIAIADEERGLIDFVYFVTPDDGHIRGNTMPFGHGVTSDILRDGKSRLFRTREDYPPHIHTSFKDRPPRTQSSIHVPLLSGGRVFGVISAQSYEPGTYAESDLGTLETMALQTAIAIENARLYADLLEERTEIARLAVWQNALLEAGRTLTHGGDLGRMIDAIALQLETMLRHDALVFYTMEHDPPLLRSIRVRYDGLPVDAVSIRQPGEGLAWAAVSAGEPLLVNESQRDPRRHMPPEDPRETYHGEQVMVAPLVVEGTTIGAIVVSRSGQERFTHAEFDIFRGFVPQLAVALHTAQLLDRRRTLQLSTIRALTAAIDARDPSTRDHSRRVSALAQRMAVQLHLSAFEQQTVELAGLLHDIGKIGVPDAILGRPGPLNDVERAVIMAHPSIGAGILEATGSPELQALIPLIRHHHEWHNGGGYPAGLSGTEIPVGARIIAVAEAYDTMTTERAYRAAVSSEAAVAEIVASAGTQFDPEVVDAFQRAVAAHAPATAPGNTKPEAAPRPEAGRLTPLDVRPITILHRLATEIASIGELPRFLERAARIISDELDYPFVSLLLPSDDGDNLITHVGVWLDGRAHEPWHTASDAGITGWVFTNGEVVNTGDVSNDTRYLPGQAQQTRSELAVPLIAEGKTIGVVNAESDQLNAFTKLDEQMLAAVAAQLAPAVQLARLHDEVKRAAERDGLTGIYNHASFYAKLDDLLGRGEQVAVFILDVEGLKRVNDTAGHLAGDQVLRRVALALEMETRPQDIVARYGGDEFAVIVCGIAEDEARAMAERLQQAVHRLTWGVAREAVRISVGVAVSPADSRACKATELVATADNAMYTQRRGTADAARLLRIDERRGRPRYRGRTADESR